jgi:hypothetical protein
MIALAAVVVGTSFFGACRKDGSDHGASARGVASENEEKSLFDFPDYPIELVVEQRTAKVIPGSNGELLVVIGDITGGQVVVEVRDVDDRQVVEERSLREGDSVLIDYLDATALLRLVSLRNVPIGSDVAVFTIGQVREDPDSGSVDDATGSDGELTESEKIERLIEMVAQLEGATFVRNGKEYSAAEAADHLREKWAWKRSEVGTADAFVERCGSRSSISGEAYLIRLADGKELSSRAFLVDALAQMEGDGSAE